MSCDTCWAFRWQIAQFVHGWSIHCRPPDISDWQIGEWLRPSRGRKYMRGRARRLQLSFIVVTVSPSFQSRWMSLYTNRIEVFPHNQWYWFYGRALIRFLPQILENTAEPSMPGNVNKSPLKGWNIISSLRWKSTPAAGWASSGASKTICFERDPPAAK